MNSQTLDVDTVIATWLATADDDRKTREDAEARARAILQANLGGLTESHLREVMRHLNTCRGQTGELNYARFSPGLVGNNANKLVSVLPRLNPLIEQLWTTPPESVPSVFDAFLAEALPGAGRSLPSAVLYLRDAERYAVWTDWIDKVLRQHVPNTGQHERSGAGYIEYCLDVHRFLAAHRIPSSLHDKAIWVLHNASTPAQSGEDNEGTAFTGFTNDTFRFMGDIVANNNETWFDKNRDRFREAVDRPLRSLVDDVAARVIHTLDPNLETASKSGKTIAKIRKNIRGRKAENVYQRYFWAAFYRREATKQSHAQLYMTIRARGFAHGMHIPPTAPEIAKRLATAAERRATLMQTIITALIEDGFAFAAAGDADDKPSIRPVETPEQLRALLAGNVLTVVKETTPHDAVAEGPDLAIRVGEDFRQLYPLFALASLDEVPDDVLDFLRDGDGAPDTVPSDPQISISALCERTGLNVAFFEKLERLLADKRQLILHGPPGTGKTLVALEYAKYLAQLGGEVVTVQFHPSYGYEDFVEGLRPVVDGSVLQYRVEPGIFRSLCDKARKNPKARFVVLIDEINRGNLPRIFGELLFLLERRDQTVALPYSKQAFSVPENVVVIGTMNSADRSIALLDLALRRRFHFVVMSPNEDVLRSWLAARRQPLWIADLLATLNADLESAGIEPDRLIGHSHFMAKDFDDDKLDLIWEATIEPLLTELFFSQPEKLDAFALERLRAKAMKLLGGDAKSP